MNNLEDLEFRVITYKRLEPISRKIALKRNLRFLAFASTAIFIVIVFALAYLLTNLPKSNTTIYVRFFINSLIIFLALFNCCLVYAVFQNIKRFKKTITTLTILENFKDNKSAKNMIKELDEHTTEFILSEQNPRINIYFTKSYFIYEELENYKYFICQKKNIKILEMSDYHKVIGDDLLKVKIEYLDLVNKIDTVTLKLPANNLLQIVLENMGITL